MYFWWLVTRTWDSTTVTRDLDSDSTWMTRDSDSDLREVTWTRTRSMVTRIQVCCWLSETTIHLCLQNHCANNKVQHSSKCHFSNLTRRSCWGSPGACQTCLSALGTGRDYDKLKREIVFLCGVVFIIFCARQDSLFRSITLQLKGFSCSSYKIHSNVFAAWRKTRHL